MDWLTADLVLKAIVVALGIMGLCTICGSLLWWCCMEEGRREWRIWWRRRQQRREVITRLDALRVIANGQPVVKSPTGYRVNGHDTSTAGASDQRRDSRLLTGSFGGWKR